MADAKVPEVFAGKKVFSELTTGCENEWELVDPQFKVYVDRHLIQIRDINQRAFLLCERAQAGERHRITLRVYSGERDFER